MSEWKSSLFPSLPFTARLALVNVALCFLEYTFTVWLVGYEGTPHYVRRVLDGYLTVPLYAILPTVAELVLPWTRCYDEIAEVRKF